MSSSVPWPPDAALVVVVVAVIVTITLVALVTVGVALNRRHRRAVSARRTTPRTGAHRAPHGRARHQRPAIACEEATR